MVSLKMTIAVDWDASSDANSSRGEFQVNMSF